jgi:hypothetical protein
VSAEVLKSRNVLAKLSEEEELSTQNHEDQLEAVDLEIANSSLPQTNLNFYQSSTDDKDSVAAEN